MNKKILLIIALIFIPTIIAVVWLLSVSGSGFTPNNVANVTLRDTTGIEWSYTENDKKAFFTEISDNLSPITSQTFDETLWKLYELEFEKTFDTATYYLCLSHDPNNCLAFDDDGKWYKISPEYAKSFLVRDELQGVYVYKDYPKIKVAARGEVQEISAKEYEWNYLLADEEFFSDKFKQNSDTPDTNISLTSDSWAAFSFSVQPDWSDVKVFDDDSLVFSGDLANIISFSYNKDSVLRVLVSAKWYEDEAKLYYGSTTTEFFVTYDVRAEAKLDKEAYSAGEIAYITLNNAEFDEFSVESELILPNKIQTRVYDEQRYMLVPISCENAPGNYEITLKGNTIITLKLNIENKAIEKANVKLKSCSADEYEKALISFKNEMVFDSEKLTDEPLWADGLLTPVIKYIDDKECYWISSPSYGIPQKVDGKDISVKNFGIHYVKSLDLDHISARAVADGKILFNGTTTAFGNTVAIDHGFGLVSVCGHLESCEKQVGDDIKKGDIIGVSSDGGIMMYDEQIFFGIMLDGVFVNPYTLISEQRSSLDSDQSDPVEIFIK